MAKNIKTDEFKEEKATKELLKKKLDDLGVTYHPNAGIVSLEAKLEEAMTTKKNGVVKEKKITDKQARAMKATSLSKVNITSMHKDDVNAEAAYCSCINSELTLSKFVPLGVDLALEEALINFFESKKMMVPVPDKEAGKGNYKYEERPWYNVKRY